MEIRGLIVHCLFRQIKLLNSCHYERYLEKENKNGVLGQKNGHVILTSRDST